MNVMKTKQVLSYEQFYTFCCADLEQKIAIDEKKLWLSLIKIIIKNFLKTSPILFVFHFPNYWWWNLDANWVMIFILSWITFTSICIASEMETDLPDILTDSYTIESFKKHLAHIELLANQENKFISDEQFNDLKTIVTKVLKEKENCNEKDIYLALTFFPNAIRDKIEIQKENQRKESKIDRCNHIVQGMNMIVRK